MKKIIVIGCPGSGKTTFATRLAEITVLPLFYLDAIWHKPDKTNITCEEFDLRLAEILSLDSYIIDGNYNRTAERRIADCDTVFMFDLPTEECLSGVTARIGKKRIDLPWIETELDPEFKSFIEEFPKQKLPVLYELLEKYKENKNIVVFRSREEANAFLCSLTERR